MEPFTHPTDVVTTTFGYHPNPSDLPALLDALRFSRLLVVGGSVPDVVALADEVRMAGADVELPRGLYWFCGIDSPILMAVTVGDTSSSIVRPVADLREDEVIATAWEWAEEIWETAVTVPAPAFCINDTVITRAKGRDAEIRGLKFVAGTWIYTIRLDGHTSQVVESALEFVPDSGEPIDWIHTAPASAERFGATLTRGKLEASLTDTVFSFRATRTTFRPYQFKPVLRLLNTGATRVLIADEVGLGKTIEAGLIWTEFEARHAADRVLVVAPSSLVGKWQREMEERFGFELIELDGVGLRRFLEQHVEGRLPRRFRYVVSIERLRTWDGLEELADSPPQLDLVVVDEAHAMRNQGTRNHALGEQLGDWADARVFLTATPVNLGHDDLASMLELLAPEDFDDPHVLALRLEPNGVLHRLERTLLDRTVTGADRLAILDELKAMTFGAPLTSRPDFPALRELLACDVLDHAAVVEARRHLSDLNALSSVITRTRKAEIDDGKALRSPHMEKIDWTDAEREFYAQYVTWCRRRADAVGMPLYFSMQMPLRLASACLPAARDAVLGSAEDWMPRDEDDPDTSTPASTVPPHLELLLAAEDLADGVDSKFDRLRPIVEDLVRQRKQTLLFTFSRPTLTYLERNLSDVGRVAVLHGGVPRPERNRIMTAFRAGAYDLVLANRVASEGLDFEFCSTVINYDLPWNPMEIEQRIGRIDRIGQPEEKIVVVNFYNDDTIDERILTRVLDRIGIFEQAIGALEPIIQSQISELQEAAFDFSLTEAERRHRTDQILTAIEAQRAEAERLAGATSDLLVTGEVDVSGLERELVRAGRYVGQYELAHLVHDWATTARASGVTQVSATRIKVRGNGTMAEQVNQVVLRGQRSRGEVRELVHALQEEAELTLLLDQEEARASGGTLLTATHPLVLAAVSTPDHRHARFAGVQIRDPEGLAPTGRFAVVLALVEGSGDRASREIWGAATGFDGREAPAGVADALLAALARGELLPAGRDVDPGQMEGPVELATDALQHRHVVEQDRRIQESASLAEARRLSLTEQLDRKLRVIERRTETARVRGRGGAQMFDGQRRRALERHQESLRSLDQAGPPQLSMTYLATCYLEIVR